MSERNYQDEAIQLLNKIKSYSGGNLNFEEDMARLFEIILEHNRIPLLEEISFHAKFTDGLLKIIQTSNSRPDEAYFIKIKSEYATSLETIKKDLGLLLADASSFIKEIFEKKYFELSQTGLSNLHKLCSDLGYVKLYFNDLKR